MGYVLRKKTGNACLMISVFSMTQKMRVSPERVGARLEGSRAELEQQPGGKGRMNLSSMRTGCQVAQSCFPRKTSGAALAGGTHPTPSIVYSLHFPHPASQGYGSCPRPPLSSEGKFLLGRNLTGDLVGPPSTWHKVRHMGVLRNPESPA